MHFYIQCFTISPNIKESVQYFIYSSMLQLIHFFSDRIFGLMCPTDLHILYDGAKKKYKLLSYTRKLSFFVIVSFIIVYVLHTTGLCNVIGYI